MIDLKQKQLGDWEKINFQIDLITKEERLMQCALGMNEEAGEVAHHVLKGIQHIRGGVDGMDVDEVADGVADCLIYGIQLLTALGRDAETEISKVIEDVLQRDWIKNPEGK